MPRSGILSSVLIFIMGVLLGGFGAVTIIREAVPLREHFYTVVTCIIFTIPIFIILLIWYTKVTNTCRVILGEKGGRLISSIITFLLISIIVVFILIMGIFFSAIA